MSFTTTQKIIKIGTSRGVTLPAKELKQLGVKEGEDIEVVIRKKTTDASTQEVVDAATSILERYKKDFKNLAQR